MKKSHTALALLTTASMLPLAASSALAQTVTPRFVVLPIHAAGKQYAPGHTPVPLQTWTGKLKFSGVSKTFIMVGTNPASTNTTTTVTVYLIPIKMVYGPSNGNVTFDPQVDQQNGVSIMQNMMNSPLFNSLDWKWGATDVGSTEFTDAFQRGSFWLDVKKNPSYHVVLAPSQLSEETINVSASQGQAETNPINHSGTIGTMDINAFDSALQTFISGFSQVNPSVLPLFVTDNIYLTSGGGCCIGGYHSANSNGQTYSYASWVTTPTFSQDISAFSHELSEWLDDPGAPHFNNNFCGGLLEVGDPLEGKPNFGTFPVSFGGVTWHPQNEVFISYFGAPKRQSANSWLDTGHIETSVCENGQ